MLILKISDQLYENWWFYVMLNFDLLTKSLIYFIHILMRKLCWKFDDKAQMVNWNFRWIALKLMILGEFDLFTKLFLFSSPYSNILIIKLSWKFDYKISNCNKVTGRTHARTHTWLQNPAFHYVRDGLINFSPLPALFSMSIDFREKRCGGNSGLQTSWRGIRHNWHLFICHRNII